VGLHRASTGSASNAIADVGGLRRVDHSNDLQLDPRRQHLKQPAATTEQHRDLVNVELVQHTSLEGPLRRVPAVHQYAPVAGGGLRPALAIPSFTYITNG
jgi:hypothetical protein